MTRFEGRQVCYSLSSFSVAGHGSSVVFWWFITLIIRVCISNDTFITFAEASIVESTLYLERVARNSRWWLINLWSSKYWHESTFFFRWGRKPEYPAKTLEVKLRSTETQATNYICSRGEIDDLNASLTSQGVQHGRFPRWSPIQLSTPSNKA